ncbi:phosphatase PAP2 family protein [Clostridium akagii]|uniref:phosphatase PAP2 family protein n=1 Tax=Clostridium akagii TaxID=91623 RepID=UPI00055C7EB0|nr:phosphatase PAP2 family protein [Clostridium akagii]
MQINVLKKANEIDDYVLLTIKKHIQNRYLDMLMLRITSLGNLGAVWVLIAMGLLLDKTDRMIGSIVLITLVISTIVGEGVVKHLVRRIRPCNEREEFKLLIAKPTSYSFPSGHTLSSFAVAKVLSVYFTEYRFIFIGIALMIALSRMYLYVHYPTDVIAGIILGLLCANFVLIVI